MVETDDRTFEYLREHGVASPRIVANGPDFSASRAAVRERCEALAEADLVAFVASDMCESTTWWVASLDGEVRAEYLPDLV
jgi:hypothetical protein